MRIFIAGASGALGRRLVTALVTKGHEVFATTRSKDKFAALRALSAIPVLMDGLNLSVVTKAVTDCRPNAVVHQTTSLAPFQSFRNFDREFEQTNRLRTEGTENLLSAARLTVGGAGLSVMTEVRGSSNAKANAARNWRPGYPSWRKGFRQGWPPGLRRTASPSQ